MSVCKCVCVCAYGRHSTYEIKRLLQISNFHSANVSRALKDSDETKAAVSRPNPSGVQRIYMRTKHDVASQLFQSQVPVKVTDDFERAYNESLRT